MLGGDLCEVGGGAEGGPGVEAVAAADAEAGDDGFAAFERLSDALVVVDPGGAFFGFGWKRDAAGGLGPDDGDGLVAPVGGLCDDAAADGAGGTKDGDTRDAGYGTEERERIGTRSGLTSTSGTATLTYREGALGAVPERWQSG